MDFVSEMILFCIVF